MAAKAYGVFALGWHGSNRHWINYEKAYLILAALSTPLVLSVHSIVSMDFAVSMVPGWHTTIFPPYFVAGAIFSGFAMVCMCLIVLRKMFHLEHIITLNHLEVMNKIIIATGLMVGYAYSVEFFMAWYSGVIYERFVFINRAAGPYAWAYWTMVSCNVIFPQLFWFRKIRRSPWLMFPVAPTDDRLPAKSPVLGVWTDSGAARAYAVSASLFTAGTKTERIGEKRLTLAFHQEANSLRVLQADDGVHWMYSLWFAWYAFHPETSVGGSSQASD